MANIEKSKVDKMVKLHNEIHGLMIQGLEKAMMLGGLLVDTKKTLGHGRFISWIEKNMPFDERTARRYMGVYEFRERLKTDRVSDLNSAYRLIENIRELDKVAKEYGVSSHTKAKVSKILTPSIDKEDIEFHVNLNMPRKEKELRAEKKADKEQGRYVENRVKEIRRELDSVTSKISRLKEYLKSAKLEQIVGFEVRDLLRSLRRFNATYEGLRPLLDGSLEDEPKKKKVDSIETRFPRKELPSTIQSH